MRESLPLSALQHWLFCPRQCALIHVEQLWAENRLTAEGRILHERADGGIPESREERRILRAVPIASERLKVHGVADVVEINDGVPFPVEYKRGRPKKHRSDEVQLCAQALCLEEMTGREIHTGALFYGEQRRRLLVSFDVSLRNLTSVVIDEAQAAISSGFLPAAVFAPDRCDACSLNDLCRPKAPSVVSDWMKRRLSRSPAIPE